jgi:multicomponent Na+:H+ antiporter subunit D
MTKIWAEVFWKEAPESSETKASAELDSESHASRLLLMVPIASLALATILIGLAAEPLYLLANRAAEQLTDPAEYIQAVLGRRS